jgi:hypothetical protein
MYRESGRLRWHQNILKLVRNLAKSGKGRSEMVTDKSMEIWELTTTTMTTMTTTTLRKIIH